MSLLEKIKALFKIKAFIDWFKTESKREVKTMEGNKPGWKTTEFWMTVITNLMTLAGALDKMIDPQAAAIIMACLTFAYSILRSLVKQPEITTLVSK